MINGNKSINLNDLKSAIKKIVIGIRHQRHFGISDFSGQIIESIIRDAKTPFKKGFFTNTMETQSRDRTLYSEDGLSQLIINSDDLIFQYSLREDFDSEFIWMVEKCFPFLIEKVVKKYGVRDFHRIGIVFGHLIDDESYPEKVVKQLTSSTLSSVDSLGFRFSKKYQTETALSKKGVNDYRNMIFSANLIENIRLAIDVDIQHYFDPPLPEYDNSDFNFFEFLGRAKKLLFNDYHPMILKMFENDKASK